MSDKRTTLDEAVSSIESGMTIGIGGWGSRRKPMAFIRALLRTDVTDLTVVTYGGPDLGLLCSGDCDDCIRAAVGEAAGEGAGLKGPRITRMDANVG